MMRFILKNKKGCSPTALSAYATDDTSEIRLFAEHLICYFSVAWVDFFYSLIILTVYVSFRCSFPRFLPQLHCSAKITSWFFFLLRLPPFLRSEFGNFSKDPLIKKPQTNEKVFGEPFFEAVPSVMCLQLFNPLLFFVCFLCCFFV